ncbi:MAG: PorP/SprF family type IX secretion system membrane protein [Muribaculaceae bacterium]|nr:PorP/SprF family type IX secretion system membrane protein [Muribaculaceae bacterium]MDE6794889.1 PorP/SprF family type IX secretion system membrane protein [Muribaculaceae bacterium]
MIRSFSAVAVMWILCVLTAISVKAQSEMIFTQHWALPTLYNPARTGDTDFLRIRGGARLQWIGVTHAPQSFVATGDMPFLIGQKRIGAGAAFSQESIGLFSNLLVSVQGSYKLKILKGQLGIGVQVGYYNSRFRGSDVYIPGDDDFHQPSDPSIPTQDLSGNAVDFSLGVNYNHRLFHVGISAMHITSPKVKMSLEGTESTESQEYETELPRTLYFDAGGNIKLQNSLFQLQPSLLAATDLSSFSAAVSVQAKYNNFISLGLGYRWNDALSIMIGAEYKSFFLGYAFDYPLSALSKASSGSHEIVAGYQLKLDLSGKNKNKHRSIRIM